MVTTKQRFKRINQLASAGISVEISVEFQKIPIPDIENFAISAADILPIRYIGTPLGIVPLQCHKHAHHSTHTQRENI